MTVIRIDRAMVCKSLQKTEWKGIAGLSSAVPKTGYLCYQGTPPTNPEHWVEPNVYPSAHSVKSL